MLFRSVNGVLLQPLPFRDAASLVRLEHLEPYQTVSEPEFVDYRRDVRSFAKLAAYHTAPVMISARGAAAGVEPERVNAAYATTRADGPADGVRIIVRVDNPPYGLSEG